MKVSRHILFAFALLLSPAYGAEEVTGPAGLDPANAWFKPALVENRSNLCSAVLEAANQLFDSPAPRLDVVPIVIKDLQAIAPDRDLDQERITLPHPNTGEPMEQTQAFVTTHGRKIYVSMRTNPGCGGACETRQMFASAKPFETPMPWNDPPSLSEPTPRVPELTLLKSRDGLYHVAVVEDRQLLLFTLTENAAWDRVCNVSIAPSSLHAEPDSELQTALKSIRDLRSTIDPLRQDAGHDCGTLRAHENGGEFMSAAFTMAMYRPWALQGSRRISAHLQARQSDLLTRWSVIGFDEYAGAAKFRSQLPLTVAHLARFYAHKFGWSQSDSALAAQRAVTAALDLGFALSDHPMTADVPVRQAILKNRSVAELEALNWRPEVPKDASWYWNESVLSIAVKHPAALRWLLSKQLDPDHANAFGKTPLMYAAQHNALEAVRILLAHGANPNAATIFPEDTCAYTLRRANMTALHYAVRYGSVEIVQALIDGGALPFVKAIEQEQQAQTPLEWLDRFASPNIADADRPRVAQLLSPPEGKQLIEYSAQQTLQAEEQYARGDLDAARRSLKNALQANPSNERALSDMSLVALRAGQYGESLEAATRLIDESHDARMLANAWFNIGLACERSGQSHLSYNGESYCMSSGIFPFLQSWLAASSRARAEKLEQLFAAPGNERCAVLQPDSTEHRYIFVRAADRDKGQYERTQRIYVLHPAGSTVSASQIRWHVTSYLNNPPPPRLVTPLLVGSHRLGKSAITVLESKDAVQRPVMIGDYKCF